MITGTTAGIENIGKKDLKKTRTPYPKKIAIPVIYELLIEKSNLFLLCKTIKV